MERRTPYFTKLNIEREWYLLDAEDEILGRLCTQVAKLLLGKHKPTFTPGQDAGAFVVVLNAEKVRLTAGKEEKKIYYHSTGYMKKMTFAEKLKKSPRKVITDSVRGMLPHNKLGDQLITKLKVYAGPEHPHKAQLPTALSSEQLHNL